MKRLINSILAPLNLEIRRKKNASNLAGQGSTMLGGLRRFSNLGINVNSVIDVGAAAGTWSKKASSVWPGAEYLLLEPLVERKAELESIAAERRNFHYSQVAAGKEPGIVKFLISEDLDGSGVATSHTSPDRIREVTVSTIPDEIKRHGLKGPFLIKLDTHGFEVPILEGCVGMLADIQLFVIEVYGFQIADNSLLFWEMCSYMDKLGFRLLDIVDVMNRPKDGAFWQCDAFFVPNTNLVYKYSSYQ
ncbi:MAG: FkbM family methyltransferase [Chryseolinea sp.]